MANEFIARKGIISLDSIQVTGSITATGGITVSGSISSASFATSAATASSADNFFVRQNLTASSALFTGSITAQTLVVQTVTSSITYSSGSNIFGNLPSNVQQFTGSLRVTGSGNHWVIGGNVGLGTSSPSYNLHIQGASPRIWMVDTTTNGSCFEVAADTTSVGIFNRSNLPLVLGTNNTTRLTIAATGIASFTCQVCAPVYVASSANYPQLILNSSNNNGPQLRFQGSGTDSSAIGHISSISDLQFSSTSSLAVQMTIKCSGNVGINTASPVNLFHVLGTSANASTSANNGVATIAASNGVQLSVGIQNSSPYGVYLQTKDANNAGPYGYPLLLNPTNGNVGIGTASPAQRLSILDANDAEGLGVYRAFSSANDAGTFIRLGALNASSVPTAGAAIFGALEAGKTSGYLTFLTYTSSTATERMRITSGGCVSIGTACSISTLTIKSANDGGIVLTRPSNDTTSHLRISTTETGGDAYTVRYNTFNNEMIFSTYSGGGTGGNIIFRTTCIGAGSETERMRITCYGPIGMGTTSLSSEANLFLGAQGTAEGGQLVLQKGTSCSCATHLDNYQDSFRVLVGTDTSSNGVHFLVDHKTRNACFYGALYVPETYIQGPTISYAAQLNPAGPAYTQDLQLVICHSNWGGNDDTGTVYVEYTARAYAVSQTTAAYGTMTYRLNNGGTQIGSFGTGGVTTSCVTITGDVATSRVLKINFAVSQNVDRISIFARTTNPFVTSVTGILV